MEVVSSFVYLVTNDLMCQINYFKDFILYNIM
jgi:hypothetical protein